ncbi:uncharacterized protein TNCV_2563821 [Trichonephila clavipes]|nr:uncharacterized protein TNCV_2563821 [Trichonephila clavipes]
MASVEDYVCNKGRIPPYPWKIFNFNIYDEEAFNSNVAHVWKFALESHYKLNSHHPEHFSPMDELSKKELLCDLLGSQLGNQWKSGLRQKWKIEHAANVCKHWSNWEIVKNLYKGHFENQNVSSERWPLNLFSEEKCCFIVWLRCLLHKKISFETFVTGLYSFKCVKYYIEDLQWHQYAIYYVWNQLFNDDKELKKKINIHDQDKWDAFMIAAYVLKFIFNTETVTIDEHFKSLSMDGLINEIADRGLKALNE